MTDTATLEPQPAPIARPGVSILAIAALVVGAVIAFLHLTIRLLDASLGSNQDISRSPLPVVLGILGLLTIIPIAGVIVLGHLALVRTRTGARRGRAIAWISTMIGYALLVLYFNRLIVAIIVSVTAKDNQFVQDFFWWA